jgi:ribosomal-protein-alanine N-acetyltransferase
VARVILFPLDAATLALASEDPAAWAAREGVIVAPVADVVREVAAQTRAFLGGSAGTDWGGFLAVDAESRFVVGTCAYKGPPDNGGAVEIAYFTFPPYEGRGFATAMAGALADRAAMSRRVRRVRAHTLPERNASSRLLEKLGFSFLGEVVDPEDGPVWRWERSLGGG